MCPPTIRQSCTGHLCTHILPSTIPLPDTMQPEWRSHLALVSPWAHSGAAAGDGAAVGAETTTLPSITTITSTATRTLAVATGPPNCLPVVVLVVPVG